MNKLDNRYSIGLEHCGYAEQKHVVRFCGDWLGGFDSQFDAHIAALGFEHNRLNTNHEETRVIIAQTNDVALYACPHDMYKVVYGADVKNYHTIELALDGFRDCIGHSLSCAGLVD
jgi:hypothetical protein